MSNDQAPAIAPVRHAAGRFVWTEGEAKPFHYYLYARRSFDLEGPPRAAQLRITAADRYLLYVNGAYVDRGPARSDPRRKSYDTHDVTDLLTSGRNVVAVRAYHYGTPVQWQGGWGSLSGNGYTVGERAGLWAEVEVTDAQGVTRTIGTDEAWRLAPAKAWRRDVDHIVYLVGNTEVYDANADPTDWMAVDFDDSAWTPAWVIPLEQVQWFPAGGTRNPANPRGGGPGRAFGNRRRGDRSRYTRTDRYTRAAQRRAALPARARARRERRGRAGGGRLSGRAARALRA